MGCQLSPKNRGEINSTEEGLSIKMTPREKKIQINHIRIRPQAIITQYKMFPENIDPNVRKFSIQLDMFNYRPSNLLNRH